nr:hypothetical protein [Salinisphaera sp. Q1T1-3]
MAWEPYLSAARARDKTRTIVDGGNGLASYRRFYLASADYARAHPRVLDTIHRALTRTGRWVSHHPQAAATRLAPLWGQMTPAVVRHALANRSYDIEPVTADPFAEQQRIADAFEKAGVLPRHVDTSKALIWQPGATQLTGVQHD